jgi:hypothetical protein
MDGKNCFATKLSVVFEDVISSNLYGYYIEGRVCGFLKTVSFIILRFYHNLWLVCFSELINNSRTRPFSVTLFIPSRDT